MQKKKVDIKNLTVWGFLCALSYVIVALIQIPVFPAAPFLELEFKDAVLMIGGFVYGPVPGCLMAVAVALLEMVTFSTTGLIGAAMNILSSCAFILPAAILYRRRRTIRGAVVGLGLGIVCSVVVMLLWNGLITPLYMGVPRQMVLDLLVPVFLPFNVIKATMNGAMALLLYKNVVRGLRQARLLPMAEESPAKAGRTWPVVAVSVAVLLTTTLVILAIRGIL